MNNFREGLNALREISDPEKAKLILEKITGKKLADYEGIDALIGALMGYYNDEVKKKQNKQDNTLKTIAKEIVPAINEINELAKKDKGERLPIGTIVPFVTDTIPLGYLLCDGREITQQDYPELYKILPFGGHINEEVFRSLAKNEVPVMRSNTQDGFTITASSEYSTSYQGWEAFDNSMGDNDGWITQNGEKNGVLTIEFPFERALSSFELTSINNSQKCHIKTIKVYGVYGNSEDEIFNETLSSVFTIKETRKFDIALKTKQYNKFKVEITNAESDVGTGLLELKLYTVDMSQFPNANQSTSKKYLPDLRDMFLRGNKQGRQLLSWQNDDNKKHNHRVPIANINDTYSQKEYRDTKQESVARVYTLDTGVSDNGHGTPISQETFSGTEARPQNISVNYIIKAKNVSSEDTVSPVIDEVMNRINSKLDKGNVSTEFNSAEKIEQLFKGNSGIDNIQHIQDNIIKEVDKGYFDNVTGKLYRCIKQAPANIITPNAEYFKQADNISNSKHFTKKTLYIGKQNTKPNNGNITLNDSLNNYDTIIVYFSDASLNQYNQGAGIYPVVIDVDMLKEIKQRNLLGIVSQGDTDAASQSQYATLSYVNNTTLYCTYNANSIYSIVGIRY